MSAKLTSQRRISPHEGQEGGSIGPASAAASFGWRNGCASPGEGVDSCRQRSQIGNPGFKWIKQHLRINSFYGTSENAVKTQIWIAVSIYVLIAIVRKRLGLEASLYQILQILSVTQFEKMPLLQALQPSDSPNESPYDPNQLILFDF